MTLLPLPLTLKRRGRAKADPWLRSDLLGQQAPGGLAGGCSQTRYFRSFQPGERPNKTHGEWASWKIKIKKHLQMNNTMLFPEILSSKLIRKLFPVNTKKKKQK